MSTLSTLAGPTPDPKPRKERPPIRGLRDGETVDVIPFNGYSKDSDLFLPWAWRKFRDDGLVELYFPGMSETGFPAFVNMMSAGTPQVLLVVVKDASGQVIDLLGLATSEVLSVAQIVMGHCGFIFLRAWWEQNATRQAAMACMRHWFETMKFDTLVGIIAVNNHLAIRFVQRVGWQRKGTLTMAHQYEGKGCDAALFEITRAEFERLEKGGDA